MRFISYDKRMVEKAIKRFIKEERNFRNPNLTLADVAESLGMARSTLIKSFSEEMHTTFLAYTNKCRLQYGRHLVMLNNGRFSMEHIALVAGFGSVRTFNKKYRDKYGELPRETRNISKDNKKTI